MRNLVRKFEFFLNIFYFHDFLSDSDLFYVIWHDKNDFWRKIIKK